MTAENTNERQFSQDQPKRQSITTTVMGQVASNLTKSTIPFVNEKNVLTFTHGKRWRGFTTTESGESLNEAELELKSAQSTISTSRIENVDLAIIEEVLETISTQFAESFQKSVISELNKATEHRQPVELKFNGDIITEIRKLWNSIELDLNDDLSLSEPSLILSPGAYSSLAEAIETDPEKKQAIEEEITEIKKQKHHEAIIRYLENLMKYSLPDDIRNIIEHRLRDLRQRTRPSFRGE